MKDLLNDELRLRDVLVSQSGAAARAGAGLDTVLEVAGQRMKQQAAVTPAAAGLFASFKEDETAMAPKCHICGRQYRDPDVIPVQYSCCKNVICRRCAINIWVNVSKFCTFENCDTEKTALQLNSIGQFRKGAPVTRLKNSEVGIVAIPLENIGLVSAVSAAEDKVVFQDQNRVEYESTPKSNSKKVVQPAASKPESKDEQFHGFEDSEIPAWVMDNFESFDLKIGFNIKPTVFVSISSKKTQKQVEENIEIPTVSEQTTTAAPIPKLILSVGGQKEGGGGGGMSKRERRRKSDNFNFVKPLYDGWYREVVWRPVPGSDGTKKDAEVFYYPPNPPGQKTLRYR